MPDEGTDPPREPGAGSWRPRRRRCPGPSGRTTGAAGRCGEGSRRYLPEVTQVRSEVTEVRGYLGQLTGASLDGSESTKVSRRHRRDDLENPHVETATDCFTNKASTSRGCQVVPHVIRAHYITLYYKHYLSGTQNNAREKLTRRPA